MNGFKIYQLLPQWKQWSLDKEGTIKISRHGFPIVPDFGGTAHAYCGATLHACLGDLLAWNATPTREAALRGYVIKSRVKETDKFLLVQPYSPNLFRQGELPGPTLLMKSLLKKLSFKELAKAWKDEETKEKTTGGEPQPWFEKVTVPCRQCTHLNDGKEVSKPLNAFWDAVNCKTADDYWNKVVSKGCDLACIKCVRTMNWYPMPNFKNNQNTLIACDGCGKNRTTTWFSDADVKAWNSSASPNLRDIFCKACTGDRVEKKDAQEVHCMGRCQRSLPEFHFDEASLVRWMAADITEAKCLRCAILDDNVSQEEVYECRRCKQTKHISKFGHATIKEWNKGKRGRRYDQWTCYECQHPACAKCGKETMYAVAINILMDGQYFCTDCRYEKCIVCKVNQRRCLKPDRAFQSYTCPDCTGSGGNCLNCGKKISYAPNNKYCSNQCRWPPCAFKKCKAQRPESGQNSFDKVPVCYCKLHR